MMTITLELGETEYQRLFQTAERFGKSVQGLLQEWITQLPDSAESFDVTQDPVFLMEGYDADAPVDLAANVDHYLYGGDVPQ